MQINLQVLGNKSNKILPYVKKNGNVFSAVHAMVDDSIM